MNSRSRCVTQTVPRPTGAATRRSPGRLGRRVGEQRLRRLQLAHHFGDGAVEQFALLGQHEAAGVAMEERDLEILLERRDLAAHGRLAHVQRFARMREAAGRCGGVEDPELVPIHFRHRPLLINLSTELTASGRQRRIAVREGRGLCPVAARLSNHCGVPAFLLTRERDERCNSQTNE